MRMSCCLSLLWPPFFEAGRRGRIRMSSSHSITKFNTVDEQGLELLQGHYHYADIMSSLISKYKILRVPSIQAPRDLSLV